MTTPSEDLDVEGLVERLNKWISLTEDALGVICEAELFEIRDCLVSLRSRLTKAAGERVERVPVVPTRAEILAAAYCWCNEKDRETGNDDVRYFEANWWALPGLLNLVTAQVAKRPEFQASQSEAAALRVERDELIEESRELTRALTGLTCGGSEFFVRRGERYVADIPACVDWVRRRDQTARQRALTALRDLKASEAREAALRERVGELKKGLRACRYTVKQQVENERYLERQAILAGNYTPDPKNTHKSAAVKALEAIRQLLKGNADAPEHL